MWSTKKTIYKIGASIQGSVVFSFSYPIYVTLAPFLRLVSMEGSWIINTLPHKLV
jgi:hypothetical protein